MNLVASYGIALLFALLVHAVVAALISFNWDKSTITISEINPYYIEATIVAENPFTSEQKRKADSEQSRRNNKIKRRRLDENSFKRKQKTLAEQLIARNSLPEPMPEPEVVEIVKPVEKNPDNTPDNKVDQEKARSGFESSLSVALRDEANMRKAVTDDEMAMAYVAQIQMEIGQNWSRPPSARNGMVSLLRVMLIPTGEVIDVKLEESSGNDAFDRSAVLAVRKAGRFVVPRDALRFERDFREFTVLFRPEDLRL